MGLIGVFIWLTQPIVVCDDSDNSKKRKAATPQSVVSSSCGAKNTKKKKCVDGTELDEDEANNEEDEKEVIDSCRALSEINMTNTTHAAFDNNNSNSALKKQEELFHSINDETSNSITNSNYLADSIESETDGTTKCETEENYEFNHEILTIVESVRLRSLSKNAENREDLSVACTTTKSDISSFNNDKKTTNTGKNKENDDLVDRILDDLIMDEHEAYAYSKHQISNLEAEDSTSNQTEHTIRKEETINSLLGLYNVRHVHAIEDHFKSLNEISDAIKIAGLENSQLIFGIDFTISNLENGLRTFNGRSLHYFDVDIKNPYQKVIEILGKTLECFDVDGRIPAFGFGDMTTKDRKVFPFSSTGYCHGFNDVLKKYNEIAKDIKLSGPTNFAPLIKEAIKIVKETKQYHILVIVADGQVTNERQTREAIVEASKYAISIIMVGVGDGPWEVMNEFDDSLPKRQFDNFQFVNYHDVIVESGNPDETFALHALMEIPDQFKAIKELGILKK